MITRWTRSFLGGRGSLRRRVLGGSQRLFSGSLALLLAEGLKTAVFARVLLEYDYGLMALALMAVGLLESFSSAGIHIMVQREGEDYTENLPAYWTLKATRGLLLAVLAFFGAGAVAAYYEAPELVGLIRFLGLSFVLRGAAGFGVEVCQRQMRFGRVALAESLSAFAALGLGLLFLFWFRNYWALAAYNVLKAGLQLIASYALFPWRPRIRFERAALREVCSFGGSISVVFMANYFLSSFERATLGKVVGLEVVGYYAMAHFLAYIPVSYLANIIAPVFLPSFREIAGDAPRLRRAFFKALFYYSAVFLGLAALFFALAKYLILVVYGEKWLPALPAFRILILFGLFRAIATLYPSVFFIKGRPWLMSCVTVLSAAVFGGLCIPFTRAWGMEGTSWALVLATSLSPTLGLVFICYLLFSTREGKEGGEA